MWQITPHPGPTDPPFVAWFTPSFPMHLTGVKFTRMRTQKNIDAAISPWPLTRHITALMPNHWLKSRTWYLWAIGPMLSAYFVISSRCTINSKSLKSYKSPKATSVPSEHLHQLLLPLSPLHEKITKNNQHPISVCVTIYRIQRGMKNYCLSWSHACLQSRLSWHSSNGTGHKITLYMFWQDFKLFMLYDNFKV